MARSGVTALGLFLIIVAGAGHFAPLSSEGYTIPQLSDICGTWLGQLGQAFSADITENCRLFALMTLGIYGSGVLGFILIIVGAFTSGRDKELVYNVETGKTKYRDKDDESIDILKKRYAKGEITKQEFEDMKKDLGDDSFSDGGIPYEKD